MAKVKRWTANSLEAALRNALVEGSRIRKQELPQALAADITWGSGPKRIRLDGHKVSDRAGVLHELLHPVLEDFLSKFDSQLEEVIVEALEAFLDARIAASPRRDGWWRREIQARLSRKP